MSEKSFASTVDIKKCEFTAVDGKTKRRADNGVIRFDYFEDIESPTIMGELEIGEESMNSLITDLPLQGGEHVEIVLETAADDKTHTFQLTVFKIYGRYTVDRFQTYRLGLVSSEVLANEMVRMGKVLEGLPSQIVTKLLKDNIGTKKKVFVDKALNKIKYQPGKKTPFNIIHAFKLKTIAEGGNTTVNKLGKSTTKFKWKKNKNGVKEKVEVQTGGVKSTKETTEKLKGTAGYLFWENKAGYNFKSMDLLYDNKRINKPAATYIQGSIATGSDPRWIINDIDFEKEIDLLDKLRHGAFSSHICFYNTGTGRYEEYAYSLDDQFQEMNHLGPQKGLGVAQADYSKYPTQMMSVLLDHETWYDGSGIASPEDKDGGKKDTTEFPDWQKHFTAQAIARYGSFNNQQVEIQVPSNPSLKVGDVIVIKVLSQSPDKKTNPWDREHSGSYLISKLNHAFGIKQAEARTFLTLIRDVYGDKITNVETT